MPAEPEWLWLTPPQGGHLKRVRIVRPQGTPGFWIVKDEAGQEADVHASRLHKTKPD